MPFNRSGDSVRLGIAVFICAAALLVILVVVLAKSLSPGWSRVQNSFIQKASASAQVRGMQQKKTCTEQLERCTTCHLGTDRKDLQGIAWKAPLRAHSLPLEAHSKAGVGCSDCHGGNGRALEPSVAHAFPGASSQDPFLRQPHVQASCARCHVPGDRPGMEHLVRGAQVYQQLGCGVCHPLSGQGKGGWDNGPDLRSGSRKSLAYLETSIVDPAANFAQSTMPSFRYTFENDRESMTDLLVYLQSLPLSRAPSSCSVRTRSDFLAGQSCNLCHVQEQGKASGRMQHRCSYLRKRQKELACGNCHQGGISIDAKVSNKNGISNKCPVEVQHRAACSACHDLAN